MGLGATSTIPTPPSSSFWMAVQCCCICNWAPIYIIWHMCPCMCDCFTSLGIRMQFLDDVAWKRYTKTNSMLLQHERDWASSSGCSSKTRAGESYHHEIHTKLGWTYMICFSFQSYRSLSNTAQDVTGILVASRNFKELPHWSKPRTLADRFLLYVLCWISPIVENKILACPAKDISSRICP